MAHNKHIISISDHMYRMAILALCSEDPNLDIAKYVPFVCLLCFNCILYRHML